MSKRRADLDGLKRDRKALVRALEDAGSEVAANGACRCPFHEDGHASGGIHQKDGAWLYTCHGCDWNGAKRTGDVIDVIRRARGVDFKGALVVLGVEVSGDHAAAGKASSPETARSGPPPDGDKREVDAGQLADEAAQRLQADKSVLDKLWRTRAVDTETARRFGVGLSADGRYWMFPVSNGGRVVAVKHHRIDPAGDGSKCFWWPKGAESRRLYPVHLDAPGPVWLCPGELKALAVVAAGRSAVGITSGEGTETKAKELPPEVFGMLHGRLVALASDDDSTGRMWERATLSALSVGDIDALTVDLGLCKADGLKDIGDLIRQWAIDDAKGPEAIGAALDDAYERSDPWRTFTLAGIWADRATWAGVQHIPTGLRTLDDGLGGGLRVGGVHLFVGKSGRAKSQTVTQIAVNAARAGKPVGFVSLEMSRRDLAHLVAANLADVPRSWIGTGRLSGEPAERFQRTVQQHAGLPLTLVDDAFWQGPLTRSGLARIVADGCQHFGWRLVVLDYLGLLAPEPDDRGEYTADLENSSALKRLARVQDIALIVVAALRKYGRKDADAATSLDDVLGAGRIVYDAVSVFNVDCEQADVTPGAKPTGLVKLLPLKTRYSGLGAARRELLFRWWPGCGRIADLEPEKAFGD